MPRQPAIVIDLVGLSERSMTTTGTGYFVHQLVQALTRVRPVVQLGLLVHKSQRAYWSANGYRPLVDARTARSAEVVIRPLQVGSPADAARLERCVGRLVLFQFDLIGLEEGYAPSPRDARMLATVIRRTLIRADAIVTLSEASASSIRTFEPSIADRVHIVPPGTDNSEEVTAARRESAPAARVGFTDGPFVLVLSASYGHKNRLVALKSFQCMRSMGYEGRLVLVGPNPMFGSTLDEERKWVRTAGLSSVVDFAGPVDDRTKQRLLRLCDLVLYPSTKEGFGLVPFEAAAAGKACLLADVSCFREVCGDSVELLNSLDPDVWARRAITLLADPIGYRQQVDAMATRARQFTWDRAATSTWAVIDGVMESSNPARAGRPLQQSLRARDRFAEARELGVWELTRATRVIARRARFIRTQEPDDGY